MSPSTVKEHDLFSTDIRSLSLLEPRSNALRIFGLGHGKPDLICLKKGGNPEDPNAILFSVEINRPILLQSRNIVTSYREQEQSGAATGPARALQQLFGYMRLNGYQYGVLSTYEQTWFLKRGSQGVKDVFTHDCRRWYRAHFDPGDGNSFRRSRDRAPRQPPVWLFLIFQVLPGYILHTRSLLTA